jgi:hypothetical protein
MSNHLRIGINVDRWVSLAAFSVSLAVPVPALAGPPPNITQHETAVLPAFCKDTQTWPGGNPDGMARGKARYGEVFWHFHHYCYAMVWLLRADRHSNTAMERRGLLVSSLDDLDYVLKYLPPDYFLLPEMLTMRGRILFRQGNYADAIIELNKAIEQNRAYWRAYSELAKCHEALGNRQAAIEVVREGLKFSPESKVLQAYERDLSEPRSSAGSNTTPGRGS